MNNNIILEGCINEFKTQNDIELSESQLFELFSITQITKNFDMSFDEIEESIVDGSQDGGIDSIIVILDDEVVIDLDSLSSYKFSKNSSLKVIISQVKTEKSFKEGPLDKLITSMPILLNLELDEDELSKRFNPSVVSKALTFREIWLQTVKKGGAISYSYYYFCKANQIDTNSAFESKQEQLIQITKKDVINADIDFVNCSAKELLDLYQKSKPTRLELKFKEVPIVTNFNQGFGYVGIVNLDDYFNFITDPDRNIIENIFESNIRHYQGDVDVNNKIKESLMDEFEIDFWWLNNGITIIAENPNQISKTLSLENVQIVNGLQTTFTLGKYFKESTTVDSDERSILVKVIVLDTEKNKKATDKIIASTNSQNAVPPTLLRATDDIQRKIEIYFLNEGFYYDRRKSYYKNIGKPSSKIFTIQTTAQAVQAILNFEPDTARAKPTTLIKTKESYEKIFNDNINFKIYLTCSLLFQKIKEYIKTVLTSEDKSLAKAYSLHLSRVLTSFLLNKGSYLEEDIINIDMNEITNDLLLEVFNFLKELISEFKESSTTVSDSSITKSGKFRDFMNGKINSKFEIIGE